MRLLFQKLVLLLFIGAVLSKEQERKRILSFGGNGMVGTATLVHLVEEYDVYLVSRGSWPFDSSQVIQPFVHSIICDRSDSLEKCDEFMQVIEETNEFYAVLDFSGFEPAWVEDAIQVLPKHTKVRVYVYVSTDSVYEVSEGALAEMKLNQRGEHVPKLLESQAKRPEDASEAKKLNKMEGYGDSKFGGETALRDSSKFPYVILRFADIIGPRDGTERWMLYHIWIKYYHALNMPISVPIEVKRIITSVTYVEDAATSIVAAIQTESAWNEAYNIACEENFNIVSAIRQIAKEMSVEGLKIESEPAEESFVVYPSVRRGPMDISKARAALKFTPTPLEDALAATIEWYNQVLETNEDLRNYMLEEFIEEVLDEDDEEAIHDLLTAVGEELGLEYEYHDEDDYHTDL